MKCLLVALVTIAVAQAAVITSQYHAQDGHHGYSYGYNNENNEKEESSSHGHVKGEYKVSDKHGLFHTEVKYEFPQEHHDHHEHHGFEHQHHYEHPKPFSYSTVAHHPEPHHHEQHHQQHHHLHKRSLWHHNNDHQQHLSHNEVFHHQPNHYGHEEQQHHWTGPVHVPVIKNGVPTESPEVQAARKHHEHKLAEAHQHASHFSDHAQGWEDEHQNHHVGHFASKVHHHDDQPKWHGPVHVPVIEHGVPTETPEVRQAKAHFLTKHTEAKLHSGHSDYHNHGNQHWSNEHEEHNQHRWTGPVHVPVIEHGVPTETPEVRHAKAHHAAKHAQTHSSHHQDNHYAQHHNHHDDHEARWNGPTHNPVIVHGVPTETPEVRHAKAHFASKHAALQQHAGHGVWDQEEHAHDHHHDHHEQHRWTGPVHVPVIKHGVPTETPEVRHAKAHLQQKFAEAQSHPDFDKDCDEKSHGQSQEWHHAHKHY